MTEKAGLSNS